MASNEMEEIGYGLEDILQYGTLKARVELALVRFFIDSFVRLVPRIPIAFKRAIKIAPSEFYSVT